MQEEHTGRTPEHRFDRTRRAIGGIEDKGLRRDLGDLLEGVEFGIAERNIELANTCIGKLVTLAHSLCRSIGGPAAVGIISGLREDAFGTGIGGLMLPGWEKGRVCDVGGTRTCKKGRGTCHSDPTGCISTSAGSFSAGYVWGTRLL